jgi:hypothetical protein
MHFEEGTSSQTKINYQKRAALRQQQDNKATCIIPNEKENATAILDSSDYLGKIKTLLAEPIYKILTCNSIKQV